MKARLYTLTFFLATALLLPPRMVVGQVPVVDVGTAAAIGIGFGLTQAALKDLRTSQGRIVGQQVVQVASLERTIDRMQKIEDGFSNYQSAVRSYHKLAEFGNLINSTWGSYQRIKDLADESDDLKFKALARAIEYRIIIFWGPQIANVAKMVGAASQPGQNSPTLPDWVPLNDVLQNGVPLLMNHAEREAAIDEIYTQLRLFNGDILCMMWAMESAVRSGRVLRELQIVLNGTDLSNAILNTHSGNYLINNVRNDRW